MRQLIFYSISETELRGWSIGLFGVLLVGFTAGFLMGLKPVLPGMFWVGLVVLGAAFFLAFQICYQVKQAMDEHEIIEPKRQ